MDYDLRNTRLRYRTRCGKRVNSGSWDDLELGSGVGNVVEIGPENEAGQGEGIDRWIVWECE